MRLTLPLIAIIDDDEGIRRALRRLLRTLRYEPVAFASGEEFLESLPACRPGCVLMDLHLPGLNAIEVLARMHEGARAPPVIVMTGFDEPGTRERCLAAGAADYMAKPIEAAHLAAAISRALQLE
jgi:FixJ family two-component response regulator